MDDPSPEPTGSGGGESLDFPEEPMDDMGGEPMPEPMAEPMDGEPAPADDKPFDDEPFDAGVEADEASDPKTYIQQLAGKIGQSLRSYTEENGIDFDLEKFAINSLISATNTGRMEPEDQEDIIEKVKGSAEEDEETPDINDVDDMNTGASEPQEAPPGPSDGGGGAPGGMAESTEDEVEESFYTLPKEHKQVFKNAKLGVTENIKTTLREYTENREEDDYDRISRQVEYGVDGHDYMDLGENEDEDYDRMGREIEYGVDGHDYIDLGEDENVSNDLPNDEKRGNFGEDEINDAIKKMMDQYLTAQNGFNNEEETPTIKPQTKPEPSVIPRRRKPYRVSPNPNPNPKATY